MGGWVDGYFLAGAAFVNGTLNFDLLNSPYKYSS
jgi:hypothetical protein